MAYAVGLENLRLLCDGQSYHTTAKAEQDLHDKDGGDDTEVKRAESPEEQGVTEVKDLPHERWRKMGSLIQGSVVRRCLKGMWKLRSP